jgi:hypothetical protein
VRKVDIGDIRGETMALKLEQKQAIVAEVNEAATNALAAVLSDYRFADDRDAREGAADRRLSKGRSEHVGKARH